MLFKYFDIFLKMLWFVTLSCEVFFGMELLLFISGQKYDFPTSIAIGIPLGIGASAISFFGCSALLGFNAFHLTCHTAGLGVLWYILFMRRFLKKLIHIKRPTKKQLIFSIISILSSLCIILTCYKIKPRFFQISCGSDLHEEISLMNSFYQGVNSGFVNIFKVRHPYCYKCIARTRWITAEHSAMMKIGMASSNVAFIAPSVLYMFTFNYVFLLLADEFLRSTFCSILALVVAYFASGFGFLAWTEGSARNNLSIDFVFEYGKGTTEWSHPIFHYIASYRQSQLSLAVSVCVMYLLLLIKKQKFYRKEFGIIGLLIGILPGTQFPAWFASVMFISLYVLFVFDFDKKNMKELTLSLIFFAIGHGLMSSFQILQFFPRPTNDKLMKRMLFFQNQINTGAAFPFLKTWFDAIGIMGVVVILTGWFFLKEEKLKMLLIAVIMLIFGNYVQMSVYNRINIVFFYPYSILIFAIVFINSLKSMSEIPKSEEGQGILIGVFLFVYVLSILSGALGFKRLAPQNKTFWEPELEEFGNWIAKNTPTKAVFISTDNDFNAVPTFAGKVVYTHNPRMTWISGFLDLGKNQEKSQFGRYLADDSYIPKVEYLVNCGGPQKANWVNNGTGKWTKEYELGDYTLFKRNLVRPKKQKK